MLILRIRISPSTPILLQSPRHVVECFLPLLSAPRHKLGWDTTITCVSPRDVTGPEIVYKIVVGDCEYKTKRLISNVGAEVLRGRGTRVWEVVKLDANGGETGPSLVLKDGWGDVDRDPEGKILGEIRASGTPEQQKAICEYFMKAIAESEVYVEGALDLTHVIKRKNKRPETVEPFPIVDDLLNAKTGGAIPAEGRFALPQGEPERGITYSAKVHRRVVFDEVGKTIQEVESLSEAFDVLADVTMGTCFD